MTTTTWYYEAGRLLAEREDRTVIVSMPADDQLGPGTALMLNAFPTMSEHILRPFTASGQEEQ